MSTDTANYGFKKDNEDEFYNVNVVNANLDKIDTEMKRIEDTIPTVSPTDSVKWLGVVAGTANALTATHAVITNYSDGLGVSFAANTNSSAATTLNINSLSAIPIKNSNGIAVSNLKANGVYTVRYRAGAFILQGESEVEVGKQIITPSMVNQAITAGVHDGTGYSQGSPNLIPANIKKGVTIFGATGTYEGDMSGYTTQYISPITTEVPKANTFHRIDMTGGYRIAHFTPEAGPSSDRDLMNGSMVNTYSNRRISNVPGYYSLATLTMIINTDKGPYSYTFPQNMRTTYMPHWTVILSGTMLYLQAYYEYDKVISEYDSDGSALTVNTYLATNIQSINSIEFKMAYTESQVTGTVTTVSGQVAKIK